jgi:hypothetical protein
VLFAIVTSICFVDVCKFLFVEFVIIVVAEFELLEYFHWCDHLSSISEYYYAQNVDVNIPTGMNGYIQWINERRFEGLADIV